MLLGPNLLDGSIAHMPFGWANGEYSRQSDGTIHFSYPDQSELGSVNVAGLVANAQYALSFALQNPAGVEVRLVSPSSAVFTHDGAVVQTFTTTTTGCNIQFRATGDGAGVLGPIELRKVL